MTEAARASRAAAAVGVQAGAAAAAAAGGPAAARRRRRHAVVVGGGLSGLTAAWELARSGVSVLVLDAAAHLGGLLRAGEVAGVRVDLGAEATLARRPEVLALAAEVGLQHARVDPVAVGTTVWSPTGPRPLPKGTVMGIPAADTGLGGFAGLLTPAELTELADRRQRLDRDPPEPPTADVSVGAAVAGQLGRPVVERVVEPLLGGVYAGHADRISLAAALPALWQRWRAGGSLPAAASAVLAAGATGDAGPVFAGLDGGMAGLAAALEARLRAAGVELRTGAAVRGLQRRPGPPASWRVELTSGEVVEADAAVVAVPVREAARLLSGVCPGAAAELGALDVASVATVALAVPAAALAGVPGSGLLVPPTTGRAAGLTVKAVTYSSRKWEWVGRQRPGVAVLRASLGRAGDTDLPARDTDLVALAAGDLSRLLARPVEVHDSIVARWSDALPQYAVGHLDRVSRVREAVAAVPGLALAGNALAGVGLPACVAAGRRAAREVVAAHWPGE